MDSPLPFDRSNSSATRYVLVAGLSDSIIQSPKNEIRHINQLNSETVITSIEPPILCHAPSICRRLDVKKFEALDLLELFAFCRPSQFCVPTPSGIAKALELDTPASIEEEAETLRHASELLLKELNFMDPEEEPDVFLIAKAMQNGGWPWGPIVMDNLKHLANSNYQPHPKSGLDIWVRLNSWAEHAPDPPPENQELTVAETRQRLSELIGEAAEPRPQQADYASAVSAAFSPKVEVDKPNVVIAEAGTGVGKTLGYIAPASVWADKNGGTVWLSTYTKNLQHQIDNELNRLHPDSQIKARRVVIRKGRENYLCLLNLEEAVGQIQTRPASAIGIGLLARWAAVTRSGDIVSGDFPAWLIDLVGYRDTLALADRRGECIYSSCSHYNKCFIERNIRQARRADLVVANHALIMAQATLGAIDEEHIPTRLIFDEGHHLFDSSDIAFSAKLSGLQSFELRRWLLGDESSGQSRSRGLKGRIEDLISADAKTAEKFKLLREAAQCLPHTGWITRLNNEDEPHGQMESFLSLVRKQVYSYANNPKSPYDLETNTYPLIEGLKDAAVALERALSDLSQPMKDLISRLSYLLDFEADNFDTQTRQRVDAACRGLTRRSENEIDIWRAMLKALNDVVPEKFIDWFSVERSVSRDNDIGMYRHWVDPTIPFSEYVIQPAHGVVITSATLRDSSGDNENDWKNAESVTGTAHLEAPAIRANIPSPFSYPIQTKIFIVNDVNRKNSDQIASAYRELFLSSNGGALGLFTAISRLRIVHSKIAIPLEQSGLSLLAQHVDGIDTASLIEIFRSEINSCILGTDAIRDGVDIPGNALRLVVFDRIPWPRPTILHRARKIAFDGNAYDDRIARLRLKQAFGRLIRRDTDRGIFVILDSRTPTRLLTAFPEGVEIKRVGIAEAVRGTKDFLKLT